MNMSYLQDMWLKRLECESLYRHFIDYMNFFFDLFENLLRIIKVKTIKNFKLLFLMTTWSVMKSL